MILSVHVSRYGWYTVEALSVRALCAALALLRIEKAEVVECEQIEIAPDGSSRSFLDEVGAEDFDSLKRKATEDEELREATADALDSFRGGIEPRKTKAAHIAGRRPSTDCACRAWAMARRLRGERAFGSEEATP